MAVERKMNTKEIRETFMPMRVCVLFVAESPPASGKFFYVNSGMTTFTSRAFEKARGISFCSADDFLEYFKDSGCYLVDLTETPVNKLKGTIREENLVLGVNSLAERIKLMRPEVVVCVLKKIEKHVEKAVIQSGVSLTTYITPFPGNGHQNKYISALAEILTKHLPAIPNHLAVDGLR
jgi:hypothetical protein